MVQTIKIHDMKKLFLVAIAGLFFAANSSAQVKRNVPQSQHMRSDSSHHFQKGKMKDQLNLTADQKSQMKALHQDMKQQREGIMNDQSLTSDQKKEKMKELRKSQSEKMNTILTPDQQAKMKELRKQRMKNHKMNHGMKKSHAS
jgi:Spy/CpxP family protein refolding chaperone